MTGLIVVAVDPATGSREALRWAAGEARLRGARLHAVMAWRPPRPPAAPAARPPVVTMLGATDAQADAEARLAVMLDAALGSDHRATFAAVRGPVSRTVLTAAAGADLLVVDPPHLSDLTRARASLLPPQLMARARCPVVIIPPWR